MTRNLFLAALLIAAVSARADTLKLDPYFDGENQKSNRIWAAAGERCFLAYEVCEAGKYKRIEAVPAAKQGKPCESCAVTYLRAERSRLKLTWDAKAGKWLGADKKPYSTATASGRPVAKADEKLRERWGKFPSIWVLDPQGNLYVTAEQQTGKFHHSSIMGGGIVEGAGQIVMEFGVIKRINNASGHYKPDDTSFKHALARLHVPDERAIEYCQAGCKPTPEQGQPGPTAVRRAGAGAPPPAAAAMYGFYRQ